MEISTVPIHHFHALLHAAQKQGLDSAQILRQAGIDLPQIEGDKARIPSATFRRLTEYLTLELQDENCGLLSQPTKLGTFAMMCNASINSPTLGQFLQRCIEFNALVSDCVSLKLERDGEHAHYSVSAKPGSPDDDELIIMVLLGITHRLSNWAIGQTIALDAVDITRDRPNYAHEYNFLFMSPIQFGQKLNRLRFAARYLDMPVIQKEQELEQFLSTPSIHLMTSHDSDRSLVSKIRTMIKEDVGGQFPEFDIIAKTLHMTTATLRRRLRAEGSSYQQLKDDIRRDTAIHHLSRGTLSMDQVAESVGFSEPTSFFRAFKRWTGVTPRAYISKIA
ncbi:MAG: AraC family transcriptional regulator [Halioglobus sp.]